jgi:hypothetical protein
LGYNFSDAQKGVPGKKRHVRRNLDKHRAPNSSKLALRHPTACKPFDFALTRRLLLLVMKRRVNV